MSALNFEESPPNIVQKFGFRLKCFEFRTRAHLSGFLLWCANEFTNDVLRVGMEARGKI